MYRIGELVLYENIGICKVADIVLRDAAQEGEEQLYYMLSPLYQNYVIYALVHATKVFMRPIISRDEAERIIRLISTTRAKAYHNRILSQLSEHYDALLKTHDCSDLVKLTVSLHAKKQDVERQKRKLGAMDERFMKRAEELLFGELAAALEIPKDKVPQYITDRVNKEWSDEEDECNT